MNSSAGNHPVIFQYMSLISLIKSHKGSLWQSRKLSWGPVQHHSCFYIIIYSVYKMAFIHRNLQTIHLINKSISEPNSLAPPHINLHTHGKLWKPESHLQASCVFHYAIRLAWHSFILLVHQSNFLITHTTVVVSCCEGPGCILHLSALLYLGCSDSECPLMFQWRLILMLSRVGCQANCVNQRSLTLMNGILS